MYKKLFKTLLISAMLVSGISNKACPESISRTLAKTNVNQNAVSISVKDIKNGNTVYQLNAKRPQTPASTLKLVTYKASVETLGKDFEFKTQLYKSTNNDLYLKLSGDPYLTSADLKILMQEARQKNIVEPKTIFIDNSIFDGNEWGEGWQWDDDLSPLMPKFSAYNLDKNLIGIVVNPTTIGSPVEVYTENFYPVSFINLAVTGKGKRNHIKLSRNNSIAPDMLKVEGTISKRKTFYIPINNPQRYFKLRFEDAIRASKVGYYKDLVNKVTPESDIYLVSEISNPISKTESDVMLMSNNYVAETVFKSAGAKYSNGTGSFKNSVDMLNNYMNTLGVSTEDIKVVDGSGVSKNNLVTADFMTSFLVQEAKQEDFEDFKNSIANPGEGTLENRMLYFKDNLCAKTGTLSDISAIAGYITSQKGKTYAFDIMITDPKTSPDDKKAIEEFVLRAIYTSY